MTKYCSLKHVVSTKAVFRGKFIALHESVRKVERLKIKSLRHVEKQKNMAHNQEENLSIGIINLNNLI